MRRFWASIVLAWARVFSACSSSQSTRWLVPRWSWMGSLSDLNRAIWVTSVISPWRPVGRAVVVGSADVSIHWSRPMQCRRWSREHFSAQLLAEEAERGDSVALQIYSELGRWLGSAIIKYIGLFEPEMLILNGAVLGASDLLLARLRSVLANQAVSVERHSVVEIVPARLGSDAALIGAVVPHFDLPSRDVVKVCI